MCVCYAAFNAPCVGHKDDELQARGSRATGIAVSVVDCHFRLTSRLEEASRTYSSDEGDAVGRRVMTSLYLVICPHVQFDVRSHIAGKLKPNRAAPNSV